VAQTIEFNHVTGSTVLKLSLHARDTDASAVYTTTGVCAERANGNIGTYSDTLVSTAHLGVFDIVVKTSTGGQKLKGLVRLSGQTSAVHRAVQDGGLAPIDYSNFMFVLISSTDNVTPSTGKTATIAVSRDGGAFANSTTTISEVGNGWYKADLNPYTNARHTALHITATGVLATPVELQL